jgi:hypothetical protein
MTETQRDEFLSLGINMYLACLEPGGRPYVAVCWHEWHDGCFWVVPRQRSLWAEYLARSPAVSFVIENPQSLGKVIGEGEAELVERPNVAGKWVRIAERMSLRYLGENGPRYLRPTLNQPRWLFRIRPTKMRTWQGIGWARHYWVEGTGGPSYEEAHGGA